MLYRNHVKLNTPSEGSEYLNDLLELNFILSKLTMKWINSIIYSVSVQLYIWIILLQTKMKFNSLQLLAKK